MLDTLLSLQGMVEVVAENYHNIWAKKKKSELLSKGVCRFILGDPVISAALCSKPFSLIATTRRRDPPAAGSL